MTVRSLQESKSETPPCRVVRVSLLRPEVPVGLLEDRVVKVKSIIEGLLEVTYAVPHVCKITEETIIDVADKSVEAEVVYEDDEVICFLIRRESGTRLHIIEQRQWKVLRKALEIFERGQTTGILLHGPPGTGKSSFLEVLRGLYGLPVVEVVPERVFRPYVGQTEKALRGLLRRTMQSAPCILFVDECEVFFKGIRRMASAPVVGIAPGEGGLEQRMRNILLRGLQELHALDVPVLILATTNLPAKFIDPAFRRAGRFDFVIHVHYPSWYMIYSYLRLYAEHISSEKVAEVAKLHGYTMEQLDLFAKMLANLGLSMSDVESLVKETKRVHEILGAKEESGFKRMTSIAKTTFDITRGADRLIAPIRKYYEKQVQVCPRWVITNEIAGGADQRVWLLPLLLHLYTVVGISVIYVSTPHNEETLREAELTAFETRGLMIVNACAVPGEQYLAILSESMCPVIILNAESRLARYFKKADRTIASWISKLIQVAVIEKRLDEIVRIYEENLNLKLTREQRAHLCDVLTRLHMASAVDLDKEFSNAIETFYEELMKIVEEPDVEILESTQQSTQATAQTTKFVMGRLL